MNSNELKVGQKFQHENGICLYVGSKNESYRGKGLEPYAIFVFKSSTDKVMIPHSSLHLVKLVDSNSELTSMTAPIIMEIEDEFTDPINIPSLEMAKYLFPGVI